MFYLDFHTHHANDTTQIITVKSLNLFAHEKTTEEQWYTVGIHPWESNIANAKEYLNRIESLLDNHRVIGVGEVGLDKLKGATPDIQQELFRLQIEIAYAKNRPIIAHCVRAWDELFAIKKEFSKELPWAVHGFNGSLQLAQQLINAGFYLSVGAALLKENTKINESIKVIPLSHLFLETDDAPVSIQSIYQKASTLLEVDEEVLKKQFYSNFQTFFGIKPA